MNASQEHTSYFEELEANRKWRLYKRIEAMEEWIATQEITLGFWEELQRLLDDMKTEVLTK